MMVYYAKIALFPLSVLRTYAQLCQICIVLLEAFSVQEPEYPVMGFFFLQTCEFVYTMLQ